MVDTLADLVREFQQGGGDGAWTDEAIAGYWRIIGGLAGKTRKVEGLHTLRCGDFFGGWVD